jgi:cytochrome c5
MRMRDLREKEVRNLKAGDSLWIGYRAAATTDKAIFGKDAQKSTKYMFVRGSHDSAWKPEHRMVLERKLGEAIPTGYHAHHKNHNSLDNRPRNLEMITAEEHRHEHAENMVGENNPMRKVMRDSRKAAAYSANMSKITSGENNARYNAEVTDEQIFASACELCTEINGTPSFSEWKAWANRHGIVAYVVKYRLDRMGYSSLREMLREAAKSVGCDSSVNARIAQQRVEAEAISQGYTTRWLDGELCVERSCEICGDKFYVPFRQREIAFCGSACRETYAESKRQERNEASVNAKRENMLRAYVDLETELGRTPLTTCASTERDLALTERYVELVTADLTRALNAQLSVKPARSVSLRDCFSFDALLCNPSIHA